MKAIGSRTRCHWILMVLVCGTAGLTGCAKFWREKPEAVGANDPVPAPPAPLPAPPEPKGPEKPPVATPPADPGGIPVARAVPGRPGFVFSPYNNKLVDVEGFPSGRMVADPHFPISEKKYFRVP